MPAIGALYATSWRGTVLGRQKPVEVITRAGVAGTGLVVGALAATPFSVETEYYGTYAQVTSWRDSALGYVGTSQIVTDTHGTTWSDVAIVGLSFRILRCVLPPGGSYTHLIAAEWQMMAEG